MTRIVLASGSPRRKELLELQGFEFEIAPADIDESWQPGETGTQYVERLALEKGLAVANNSNRRPSAANLTIAADTIVEQDGQLLGKPTDRAHAATMLRRLSGAAHFVHTGIAVVLEADGQQRHGTAVASTKVRFHPMSQQEIDWYVGTGEPMDKAGAYGIQAHGAVFVAGLVGSYFNVVGLPLDSLYRLVQDLGVSWCTLTTKPASR